MAAIASASPPTAVDAWDHERAIDDVAERYDGAEYQARIQRLRGGAQRLRDDVGIAGHAHRQTNGRAAGLLAIWAVIHRRGGIPQVQPLRIAHDADNGHRLAGARSALLIEPLADRIAIRQRDAVYRPFKQQTWVAPYLVVRTVQDPQTLVPVLGREIAAVEPGVVTARIRRSRGG